MKGVWVNFDKLASGLCHGYSGENMFWNFAPSDSSLQIDCLKLKILNQVLESWESFFQFNNGEPFGI